MLAAAFALLLAHDVSLIPSYADDPALIGLRPAVEVKKALAAAALSSCATGGRPGSLVVDVEILAAGFVDRVTVLDDDDKALDTTCVVDALRALAFKDRGKEPASHAVVRLVVAAEPPPPGLSPHDVGTALVDVRDNLSRCVERERQTARDSGGTVVARFTAHGDGSVDAVDASAGTLHGERVRVCVVAAVAAAHLAGGRAADARVVFPFFFEKPAPKPDKGPPSPFTSPTLFDYLGCAGAFGGSKR